MAKQLDYYAGYPNQQGTPKWVGVTLGSLFGGMTLIALAVGIRLAIPARTAEASMLPAKPQVEAPVLPAGQGAAEAVAQAQDESAVAPRAATSRTHQLHGGKRAHKALALASHKPSKAEQKYKRTQLYAKSVAGSRRDKRARDDLDRMLGL